MEELLLACRRGHLQSPGESGPHQSPEDQARRSQIWQVGGSYRERSFQAGVSGLEVRSGTGRAPPVLSTVLMSLFGWEQALKAHTASR